MYLGSPPENENWFPEVLLIAAIQPNGTRQVYRGELRHTNIESALTQPPLKVVDVWLQVAEKQL